MDNTILSISLILAGAVISLTGFKIIRPFPNDEKKRLHFERLRVIYQYGGLLLIAFGIFKLIY